MATMGWARANAPADPYAAAWPKVHTSPCALPSQKLVERRPVDDVSDPVGPLAAAVDAGALAPATAVTPRDPRNPRAATATTAARRARRRRDVTVRSVMSVVSALPRRRDAATAPRRCLHPKFCTATPRPLSRAR